MSSPAEDPFGTAERRQAVLDAWAASPTRFREDANAEEELASGGLGGYADRLVVELAQNASDAAVRAGVPGVLRLSFDAGVLSAANTGAPLDASAVDGLTSLRASSKVAAGSETVGRFGVGFAAVLGVTDEPEVRSRTGGLRFSATATRDAVLALGGRAAAEAGRRGGRVPVLRLAWPVAEPPLAGFDTEVRLPVRPDATGRVEALLAQVDPVLLLALPGLVRLEVGDRVLERRPSPGGALLVDGAGAPVRWLVERLVADVPAALVADRPLEEQAALGTSAVLAAVPVDADGAVLPLTGPQVVHAPTPTDEPLSLPLHLAGSFPLEVSRRRVAAGPLTDWVAGQAATAATALLARATPTPALLGLVPRPQLAGAALDAALGAGILAGLREARLLPPADPEAGDERLVPRDAVVLDDNLVGSTAAAADLVDVLAGLVPGLLGAEWTSGRAAARTALDSLGVHRLDLGGVVDAVAGLDRPPTWWHRLYQALAALPPGADADALAALPVPLADGRTVTGARGVILGEDVPGPAGAALGLRIVHADAIGSSAAVELLTRLGAQPATPRVLLADDRVRAAVADSLDADDPDGVARAVLALVAAAGIGPDDEPWLAELALPTDDGDWAPAGELLLPDSPLVGIFGDNDDSPFGVVAPEFAVEFGAAVLASVGCLATFAVLTATDLDVRDLADLGADDADLDLDGLADWAADVEAAIDPTGAVGIPPGTRVSTFRAVRDLDLVDPEQWAEALLLLSAEPLRSVLAAPAVAVTPAGDQIEVPAYSRWWLAREPVLGGSRPLDLRTADADDLVGLYDPAPDTALDTGFLAILGCRTGLLDALAAGPAALLERLADPVRTVVPWVLPLVYARIAEALAGARVTPPRLIRVAPDTVVDAEKVAVLDQPWRLPALAGRAGVLGGDDPIAVAELLDVPLLSEL